MTMGSFVLLACLAAAVVMAIVSRRRNRGVVDLGTVSHQWMAEQRIGQSHDRQH